MELTWPEECWIKFCGQLIRERDSLIIITISIITLFMNWYNKIPSTAVTIPPYSIENKYVCESQNIMLHPLLQQQQ
jgi:hypothetical protein